MKFQEGDKIEVKSTGERGIVVEWIDKKMLVVEVDGIRFPVYADQLDFPYFREFSAPKKQVGALKKNVPAPIPPQEKKVLRTVEKDGVWLSFFPILDKDVFDDDIISHYRIFLLNHTDDHFEFSMAVFFGIEKDMESKWQIRSLEDMYLFDLSFERLNDQPRIEFDFIPQKKSSKKVSHFEVIFKVKPKQIFKLSESVLQEQKASFNMSLFETFPDIPEEPESFDISRLDAAGFKVYSTSKPLQKGQKPPIRTLIDLHADKLPGYNERLSASVLLDMQLKALEKFYDDAMLNRLSNIIVVHGVGSGKLKQEVHEWLSHRKEVTSFVNRLHPVYGIGATEVFLKY